MVFHLMSGGKTAPEFDIGLCSNGNFSKILETLLRHRTKLEKQHCSQTENDECRPNSIPA